MDDTIIALLKVHAYFKGLSDEAIEEVVANAHVSQYSTNTIVHEAGSFASTISFVLRGRLKAMRVDDRGVESLFRMIERGEQFGMMIGALSEPVPIRIVALEPTTVLSLDHELAMELSTRRPELRRLWLTSFAGSLRNQFLGTAARRAPGMLALVHESPATRPVAQRLASRLCEVGESLGVLSDSDQWRDRPELRVQQLRVEDGKLDPDAIRLQVAGWQDVNRIIFDMSVSLIPEHAQRMMEILDRVVYFVPAAAADSAIRRLQSLDAAGHGWRDKIAIAWLLESGASTGPYVPGLDQLAARDFKIADVPPAEPFGRSVANSLERLVHDLRGIRIGLALGGGAARGMSHLGVLKALDDSGIVVDMIAGTSAGAMTGIVYSSGLDPDYSARQFANDLRPSWLFRQLPRGDQMFLLYKYRRGHFDPMLRKYLHDWRLEQLPVPCLAVTVDLVSGVPVVRERGDAIHAILESINLPVLSVPICRNGQALVDGGLVNNIPADVLVARGCNFVIAVSVTAKMEKQFCDIKPGEAAAPRSSPGMVQTLLRSLLVQNHCLNAHGVQPADLVVEPDVTGFELTAFVKTNELAAIGEAAAVAQVPRIRQLLNRLDPQLFKLD